MPRRSRIAVPHYPHHIVQRGHNRRAVFVTDQDRLSYLETLQEFRLALELKVYSYCLMTNHVHLIVDPGADAANLGLLVKRLTGRHTRRINRLEHRTGTSWEGRFTARSNLNATCSRARATSISTLCAPALWRRRSSMLGPAIIVLGCYRER